MSRGTRVSESAVRHVIRIVLLEDAPRISVVLEVAVSLLDLPLGEVGALF